MNVIIQPLRMRSSKVYPIPSQNCSEVGKECRICLDSCASANNPLLSPCECRGSVEYIHRDCVLEWINSTLSKAEERKKRQILRDGWVACELCQHKMKFQWSHCMACNERSQISQQIRQFFYSFLALVVSLAGGLCVLIYSIERYCEFSRVRSELYDTEQGVFLALIVVMAMFSVILATVLARVFLIKETHQVISVDEGHTLSTQTLKTVEIQEFNKWEVSAKQIALPKAPKRQPEDSQSTVQPMRAERTANNSIFLEYSAADE